MFKVNVRDKNRGNYKRSLRSVFPNPDSRLIYLIGSEINIIGTIPSPTYKKNVFVLHMYHVNKINVRMLTKVNGFGKYLKDIDITNIKKYSLM